MQESRELVKVVIDELEGKSEFTFVEGRNFKLIRVFPASRYSNGGARALTPEELNQAIQMWMNKTQNLKDQKIKELEAEKDTLDRYLHGIIEDKEKDLKWYEQNRRRNIDILRRQELEIRELKSKQSATEKTCETCRSHKKDGLVMRCFACSDFGLWMAKDTTDQMVNRIEAIEQKLSDYPLSTLYERQGAYRQELLEVNSRRLTEIVELQEKVNSLDCERKRHVTDINILDKKIKALEDQHRGIPDHPENYTAVDCGHQFGIIWIPKDMGSRT